MKIIMRMLYRNYLSRCAILLQKIDDEIRMVNQIGTYTYIFDKTHKSILSCIRQLSMFTHFPHFITLKKCDLVLRKLNRGYDNHKQCHSKSRCRKDPNYEPSTIVVQNPVAGKFLRNVIINSMIYK